ncbi:hypothetical protein EDD86DRAFT_203979 [Gorgonomyces haynaldii]|nr:hypothetical protein EDD86DRAFT_203979 [Gorgonomyces haynaldii]
MTHPKRSDSFDPIFLFDQTEGSRYLEELIHYRKQLFRMFLKYVPCPEAVEDDEYKKVFMDYIHYITSDMRISRSLFGWLVHFYILYTCWTRACYNPETARTQYLPRQSPELVDFCSLILYYYHLTTTISHFLYPKLEYFIMFYGSFIVNSVLVWAWWQVPSKHDWILSGGVYQSWNAVYTPLFWWFVYLWNNRNRMGLSYWEHMYDIYECVGYTPFTTNHSLLKPLESVLKRLDFTRMRLMFDILHRIFLYLTPLFVIRLFAYYRSGWQVSNADVVQLPSWLFTLFLCAVCYLCMTIWYTYLTFQIHCVYWFKDLKSGVVLNFFEGESTLALVF